MIQASHVVQIIDNRYSHKTSKIQKVISQYHSLFKEKKYVEINSLWFAISGIATSPCKFAPILAARTIILRNPKSTSWLSNDQILGKHKNEANEHNLHFGVQVQTSKGEWWVLWLFANFYTHFWACCANQE